MQLKEVARYGFKECFFHIMANYAKKNNIKAFNKWDMFQMIERDKVLSSIQEDKLIILLSDYFCKMMGYDLLDLNNPIRFTEKIQWIKLNGDLAVMTERADKFKVRDYIEKRIGNKYCIPILNVWTSIDDVNFDELPEQFVLKMNHGSGMNYVVKDKNNMDISDIKKHFYYWQKYPFWARSFETQYRFMERKIIAEKYIEEIDGSLYDYKIHCFDGKAKFIQCIGDRDIISHTGYQKNYDLAWNELDWTFADYPDFPYPVLKPKKLEEMIFVAEKLALNERYVRIDLYEINGNVYFGEITYTPSSGIYPYKDRWTKEKDVELGNWISI